jgi:hypothetical protein
MTYGVASRDYLRRAQELLRQPRHDGLFYAAFELRCGIEQRLHEYAEAHAEVVKLRRQGWRIPNLAKAVEDFFQSGDTIIELVVHDEERGTALPLFYTPVTGALRSMSGRLNEYLHAAKKFEPDDAPWWQQARAFLASVVDGLRVATFGTLLGPPLLSPGRPGRRAGIRLVCEVPQGVEPGALLTTIGTQGNVRLMEVKHHRTLPDHLILP